MTSSRRAFVGVLSAGLAGFALDPDRLLWVPWQRTFFLPSVVTPHEVEEFLQGLLDRAIDQLINELDAQFSGPWPWPSVKVD